MIQDSVDFALESGIPGLTNIVMDKMDGYFHMPIAHNWVVDWETPEPAIVSDIAFQIGVKGLMFDDNFPEIDQEPQVEIPDMPYHDTSRPEQY